ncbi:MAG: hypothetical protein KBS98_04725 [Flavobacterium sp.]|nr:hypothetical protein [Candidatus Neoflavobacterium equi]
MDQIKRILGVLWLLLAIVVAYYSVFYFGIPKITSEAQEDIVFGVIILCVLTPIISLGLGFFGYFALSGAYDKKEQ